MQQNWVTLCMINSFIIYHFYYVFVNILLLFFNIFLIMQQNWET